MLVSGTLTDMKRAAAVVTLVILAGCAGGGVLPAQNRASTTAQQAARATRDAAAQPGESSAGLPGESSAGLPGESSAGLPGESSAGLPGESSAGLPGESSAGLPGAQFACVGLPPAGTAACTIAINLNVPPNPGTNLAAAQIPGLHPADLQAAYALPSGSSGGVVAVVDAYDAPSAEQDLAVYRAAFGLPACTSAIGCFRMVYQSGRGDAFPAPNTAWAQETALDLEMVSAACPRCSIVLVEANSALLDDLGAAVDAAARLGARAISNSYYAIEWSSQSVEDAHYNHPGVAITASSGDRGYASYPAASPYVTAVSGTALTHGSGGWTESVWPYSGHGCSKYAAKPWWQRNVTSCSKRSAVDVAAVADPQTGVATFAAAAGGWVVAGGTSVGAPLIAAAYALSGHPDGPSYSYLHASSFHPIDTHNGRYSLTTGLGSPNGVAGL
ncbi:MAG: hypothetical protein QOJ39_2258 [Candidatus Eremiobacteraeota bacterium]|nr:hypothetical protein [Candidatus Eremiobacteraeota bacterium]